MKINKPLHKRALTVALAAILLCMPLGAWGAQSGDISTGAQVFRMPGPLSLDMDSASLQVGGKLTLHATAEQGDAAGIVWSTSDSGVATVENGVVAGQAAGQATITATLNGSSAACAVTVVSSAVPVSAVSLSQSSASLKTGETLTLAVSVAPDNATNMSVSWKSDNEGVASVSGGNVTARSAGKAVITVTTADGGKTAFCEVTVADPSVIVSGVSLDKAKLELTAGETASLKATVTPENATNKTVGFTSSDDAVASVDGSGTVTAKAAGTATITAKTGDGGKTASCEIQVKAASAAVTGVSINQQELTLKPGETATLTAVISPENATNKNMSWSSSNTKVASVDKSGLVTAKEAGTANITVTTTDGSKTAACQLTVSKGDVAVAGVKLEKTKVELVVGKTAQLKFTVTPADATKKTVTWKSSDEKIARVDENGLVTAVAEGKATVTVTTDDGGKTATCTVNIKKDLVEVTGITLDMSTLKLDAGKTASLTAKIQPENATDVNLRWSSSNGAVASVENGTVKALAAGDTTITVTTEDGNKTASCKVTVAGGASPSPAPGKNDGGLFLWLGIGLLILAAAAGITLVVVIKKFKGKDDDQGPGPSSPTGAIPRRHEPIVYEPADEEIEIDGSAFEDDQYSLDEPMDEEIEIDQSAFQRDDNLDALKSEDFQDMASGEIGSLEEPWSPQDDRIYPEDGNDPSGRDRM